MSFSCRVRFCGSSVSRASLWLAAFSVLFASQVWAQPQPTEEFELETKDGHRIAAYWYASPIDKTAPVAVLLHNSGFSHFEWVPLLQPLLRNKLQVLSIDFRGHGKSRQFEPEIAARLRRRDTSVFDGMIHDVEAAIRWLHEEKDIPKEKIALVGGEYGSSLAMLAMQRDPQIRAAVAITPQKRYYSIDALKIAEDLVDRPLQILTTKTYYYQGASEIRKMMRENPHFKITVFPKFDGKGCDLLNLSWNAEKEITEWLRTTFAEPEEEEPSP